MVIIHFFDTPNPDLFNNMKQWFFRCPRRANYELERDIHMIEYMISA